MSTDSVVAFGVADGTNFTAGPAVVVPGLQSTVETDEDSRLLVLLDFREWLSCPDYGGGSGMDSKVEVLLDGSPVASREFFGDQGNLSNVQSHTLVSMSVPLGAGLHTIDATLRAVGIGQRPTTTCIGSPNDDGNQARMAIIELHGAGEQLP